MNSFEKGFIGRAAQLGIKEAQARVMLKKSGFLDDLKAMVGNAGAEGKAALERPGLNRVADQFLQTPQFQPEAVQDQAINSIGQGGMQGLTSTLGGMAAGGLGGAALGGLGGMMTDDPAKKKSRLQNGALLGAGLGGLGGGALGGMSAGGQGAYNMHNQYSSGLQDMFKNTGLMQ